VRRLAPGRELDGAPRLDRRGQRLRREHVVVDSASGFAAIVPINSTMGDYFGPASVGLPGGVLYPMWAAPASTTNDAGVPCQGGFLNLRVRARTIDLH
jgi:hypothetical protein